MDKAENKEDIQQPSITSPLIPPREPVVGQPSGSPPAPKTPPQADQKKRTQIGSSNPSTPQPEQSKKANPLLLLSSVKD